MQIKDAVAVVTGGASGLGLATTKRLLDAGAQVVVLDLRGKEAVDELGDRATFAQTDVTDEAAVTAALDAAESLGPLRIVVNCAGTGNAIKTLSKDGPFPLDAFRKIVEINLIGTFNVIRLARRAHGQDRARSARNAASSSTPHPSRRSTARSVRRPTRRPRAAWSA